VQILRARPRYFAVRYVVKVLPGRVMYQSVCNLVGREGVERKMAFIFGRGKKISEWLEVRPRLFWDWEKREGVLTPELCDEHKQQEGTPMLLDQANREMYRERSVRSMLFSGREILSRWRAKL
jgi:hypothetical protein